MIQFDVNKIVNGSVSALGFNIDEKIGSIGVVVNKYLEQFREYQESYQLAIEYIAPIVDYTLNDLEQLSDEAYDALLQLFTSISKFKNFTCDLLSNVNIPDLFHLSVEYVGDETRFLIDNSITLTLKKIEEFDPYLRYNYIKLFDQRIIALMQTIHQAIDFWDLLGTICNLFSGGNIPSVSDIAASISKFTKSIPDVVEHVITYLGSALSAAQGNIIALGASFIELVSSLFTDFVDLAKGVISTSIAFEKSRWAMKYSFLIPTNVVISTLANLATSIVSIAASYINPIVGLAIYGVGQAVTNIGSFIKKNVHLTNAEMNFLGCDAFRVEYPIRQESYVSGGVFDTFYSILEDQGFPIMVKITWLGYITYIWRTSTDGEHWTVNVETYSAMNWSPSLKMIVCQNTGQPMLLTRPGFIGGSINWSSGALDSELQDGNIYSITYNGIYDFFSNNLEDLEIHVEQLNKFYLMGALTSEDIEHLFHDQSYGTGFSITYDEMVHKLVQDSMIWDFLLSGQVSARFGNLKPVVQADFSALNAQSVCAGWLKYIWAYDVCNHYQSYITENWPNQCAIQSVDEVGSFVVIDANSMDEVLYDIDQEYNGRWNANLEFSILEFRGVCSYTVMYQGKIFDTSFARSFNNLTTLLVAVINSAIISDCLKPAYSTNIIGRGRSFIQLPSYSSVALTKLALTLATAATLAAVVIGGVIAFKTALKKKARLASLKADLLAFSDDFKSTDKTKVKDAYASYRKASRQARFLSWISGEGGNNIDVSYQSSDLDYSMLAYFKIQ